MKISTRDFGRLEIEDKEILQFIRPIYGFEELKQFVLLSDSSVGSEFVWLQSIEDENICFILANPLIAMASYHPKVGTELEEELGGGELVPWCIAIISSPFQSSTINLKSPILINPQTKLAAQIVLEEHYPIRQNILSGSTEEVQ